MGPQRDCHGASVFITELDELQIQRLRMIFLPAISAHVGEEDSWGPEIERASQ